MKVFVPAKSVAAGALEPTVQAGAQLPRAIGHRQQPGVADGAL